LTQDTGVVSLQVLQEYFVAVTRKLHVDPRIARRKAIQAGCNILPSEKLQGAREIDGVNVVNPFQ